MERRCARCRGDDATTGVLCGGCADKLEPCAGLLPDHLIGAIEPAAADAWLIDPWGAPHGLRAEGTTIGRTPGLDFVILNESVSRKHADITEADQGWQVRDLGSRNGTRVERERVQGRAIITDGARVAFGDAAFFFTATPGPLPAATSRSLETAAVADSGAFRYLLRPGDADVELCLIGSRATADAPSAGALLHREAGTDSWSELTLPPLEFQLLSALCASWLAEAGSPARARGCVQTKQLARKLPFQSRYANEENVRQVVRRVRSSLKKIGVEGLLEAVPGRGYYVTWPVSSA